MLYAISYTIAENDIIIVIVINIKMAILGIGFLLDCAIAAQVTEIPSLRTRFFPRGGYDAIQR